MPRESHFDAARLRELIKSGRDAGEICAELGIKKPVLKTHIFRLMQIDREFYEIGGMDSRITMPTVKKTGLTIPLGKMEKFGFSQGDEVLLEKREDGVVVIRKK